MMAIVTCHNVGGYAAAAVFNAVLATRKTPTRVSGLRAVSTGFGDRSCGCAWLWLCRGILGDGFGQENERFGVGGANDTEMAAV